MKKADVVFLKNNNHPVESLAHRTTPHHPAKTKSPGNGHLYRRHRHRDVASRDPIHVGQAELGSNVGLGRIGFGQGLDRALRGGRQYS